MYTYTHQTPPKNKLIHNNEIIYNNVFFSYNNE